MNSTCPGCECEVLTKPQTCLLASRVSIPRQLQIPREAFWGSFPPSLYILVGFLDSEPGVTRIPSPGLRSKTEGISIDNNPGKDYILKIQLFPSAGSVRGASPDVLFLTSFNPKFTFCGRKSSCFPQERRAGARGSACRSIGIAGRAGNGGARGQQRVLSLCWSLRSPPTQGIPLLPRIVLVS